MAHPKPTRPPPDAGSLHTAALNHLARYAATEAGLARVLARKIERWARTAEAEPAQIAAACAQARAAIPGIIARLASAGALSDAAFATARARSLARAGRSRRAIGAHLAEKGVPAALASAALPPEANELAAALIHARKRRLGPWRTKPDSPEAHRRALASLARAGFAHSVASAALRHSVDEAEALIIAYRAGL